MHVSILRICLTFFHFLFRGFGPRKRTDTITIVIQFLSFSNFSFTLRRFLFLSSFFNKKATTTTTTKTNETGLSGPRKIGLTLKYGDTALGYHFSNVQAIYSFSYIPEHRLANGDSFNVPVHGFYFFYFHHT